MTVRYVGASSAQIMDTKFVFKRYGQQVELPDELATRVMAENFPVVTEEEFKSLGHTEDELKNHANPATHAKASAEFLGKRKAAWDSLSARATAAEPLPPLEKAPPQEEK